MAKEKTFRRECQQSITLVRNGKRVSLTTGQVFDFTEDEYNDVMSSSPSALSATSTVDLDTGDVDLKKVENVQAGNQSTAPTTTTKDEEL